MSILWSVLQATKSYNKVKKAYADSNWDISWTLSNLTWWKLELTKIDNQEKYPTFSTGNVKSTVNNPSKDYPWISKEDEERINNIINKYYSWASDFEKRQAYMWLYEAALDNQRNKDIEQWRQEVKMEYMNKAKNAKSTKERNTYMSEVKKADLADLIKEKLKEEWYVINDNITDDWIIAWFLEVAPQYEDDFNKYFYSDNDAVQLWKDLWWLEKSTWDKTKDKAKSFITNTMQFIPKFWEWVKDTLDLTADATWYWKLDDVAWANFVQEKYWTYPAALTDADYKKAREEFETSDKKEYTPTVTSATTKLLEWWADIAFTAFNPASSAAWKSWFAALAETPYLEEIPNTIWEIQWWVWKLFNTIPWFSDIRESLQTEQEKADWDAFVWWALWWWYKKGRKFYQEDIKNINVKDLKTAYDRAKQLGFKEWINTIKEWIETNRKNKIQEQKNIKAQQITQWDINTREREARWLDYLDEQWKLKWIKTTEDFTKVIDSEIENLRKEQTEAASKDTKRYWENDIATEKEVQVLDSKWNKTTQKQVDRSFSKLIDELIDHYEETDKAKATTYKSYKRAFQNWELPMDVALEIKREWNNLWQSTFTKKSQIPKNSEKAEWWWNMMKNVNEAFDNLDLWEEIRARDSKLSSLYSIKNNIAEVERRAADMNKKAVSLWVWKSIAQKIWNITGKFINKISFWLGSLWTKTVLSLVSWLLWDLKIEEKTSYTPAEIKAKIPEFIKEYQDLNKKLQWKDVTKNLASKFVREWADKWESTLTYNRKESKNKKTQ